ncbi:hypothetical protein LTR91_001477 [Friedmanniomyces endolithicus]|uniref:J domain-containing protein n=1 Tax=Friedmanniomyces endolithicus TaxID=329885 RepID=A0AAN6L276_9PEZI|nr:hypothetical protein LTR82_001420 [Friedmanniomyces endolithicus]KAK0984085.1 hypothetical protein LTS01_010834 [Friedmanniomyces endolithicus]KAK1013166.1 hypothetical protein LTR91_001477 [Friedmanniomyces endolithicus]KAK1052675.1 hypothetical protein LTS16_001743 [Friedmanniomyces endolithicus]
MVKADIKHNYYTDLELPTTCSIDDVKRQYRRLALIYHPDRNAGKEEEVVPKFQAIQTAHEVLSDPTLKFKYDNDRAKAALLYPSFRRAQQTAAQQAQQQPPSTPFSAASPYPPPPRRTQPGSWSRPQPAATGAPPNGATPTGADRFSNFTRSAPTARRDPMADRSSNFKAWQNLNTAQERQQQQQQQSRFASGGAPPPGGQQSPQPSPSRPRPPPRADTKLPSEDEIRAGMNYRKPAPPPFDPDRADARQTAWQSFQQSHGTTPGVGRSNTARGTPRKPGFDPNVPGSDERPAAESSGYTSHRHRSEDFGRMPPGSAFPPPPPGPPPTSPTSPTAARHAFAETLRPSKSRGEDAQQAPYAEGTRTRTPYTNFVGEKTQFAREPPEGLRRTASTLDATKLNGNGGASGRARSTSPLGRTKGNEHQQNGGRKPFVEYSDSDVTDNGLSEDSDNKDEQQPSESRPGTAPQSHTPYGRPKKVPTPPSRHYQSTDGADHERSGMQQKESSNNMYVDDSDFVDPLHETFKNFKSEEWRTRMFGTLPTYGAGLGNQRQSVPIPPWAFPSSVMPGSQRDSKGVKASGITSDSSDRTAQREDATSAGATGETRAPNWKSALFYVQQELEKRYGDVDEGLDMDVLVQLASTTSQGHSTGHSFLDMIVARAVSLFLDVTSDFASRMNRSTCADTFDYSFTFPFNQEQFAHANKSRSEEQINTKFTPEGWNGQFTASGDYFAPPPPSTSTPGRKPVSPGKRQRSSGLRPSSASHGPSNLSANGTAEAHGTANGAPGEVKFSKEQWEKTFQDASWSWPPPPPPNVPASLAGKGAPRAPGRKASKAGARLATPNSHEQPHVVDENAPADAAGPGAGTDEADDDKMDIDSTPPAQHQDQVPAADSTPTQQHHGEGNTKEARVYAVPPSAWLQQQTETNGHTPHRNTPSRDSGTADNHFTTNLDDLANVEPLAPKSTNAAGLNSLSDVHSTLPFPSQASTTLPSHDDPDQTPAIQMPALPKAPEPPTKLTKQSWHAFATAFGAYLQAFHAFNTTMLQHFGSRERGAQDLMGTGMGWLEAAGDSADSVGFGGYAKGAREDERVRELWQVGCERHAEAVKGFEGVRERVRRVGAAGGLG